MGETNVRVVTGMLVLRNGKKEPMATETFNLSWSGGGLTLTFSVIEARGGWVEGKIDWSFPGARLRQGRLRHSLFGIPGRLRLANRFGQFLVLSAGHGIIRSCPVEPQWFTLVPAPPVSPIIALAFQADVIAGSQGIGYSIKGDRVCRVHALTSQGGVWTLRWYGGNAAVFERDRVEVRNGSKLWLLASLLEMRDECPSCLA